MGLELAPDMVRFDTFEQLIPDIELGENRHPSQFPSHPSSLDNTRLFKSHQPYLPNSVVLGASENKGGRRTNCREIVGEGMEFFQCLCPNCPARFRRAVLIVRDGWAALCSYYKFQLGLENFEGTFGEFIRNPSKSHYGYDWSRWNKSWLDSGGGREEVVFVGAR